MIKKIPILSLLNEKGSDLEPKQLSPKPVSVPVSAHIRSNFTPQLRTPLITPTELPLSAALIPSLTEPSPVFLSFLSLPNSHLHLKGTKTHTGENCA